MIELETVEDISLEPEFPQNVENISVAVKNYVLFAKHKGKTHIFINPEHLPTALDYLSKQDLDYPVSFLEKVAFESLYNKFLEKKTDQELENISAEGEGEDFTLEEMNLSEFLRTSKDLLESEESAPVIKFVNSLFYQAIKKKASDIHIELHENKSIVRFRIDGALVKHADIDNKVANLIVSRIKVISNLDISEKRIPQDGRTQVKIAGKTIDTRVSVLPTYYGERIVMRILMQSSDIPHLQELGFEPSLTSKLDELVKHSHGMILVTGPTGSGKSTTLHAFLQQVATPDINIITVEDPVEYKADNINQIQVNPKVGLTFASGLRSILRQDPDVVMVGEIRDSETAEISVQAALTGHLVFSTLHTNNATASITRLMDMGVEKFLITSSIIGVIAQRLVRKLCKSCKKEDRITIEYAEELGLPLGKPIFRAEGCAKCNYTGYSGRVAIGELFVMDEHIRQILKEDVSDYEIRKAAITSGMVPLSEQLKSLLLDGTTSIEEIIRIGVKDD